MKFKIKLLTAFSIGLLFTSCNDTFDYGEDNRVSYDYIFSDYGGTGDYVNTCMSHIPALANWRGGNFLAAFTDEGQDGSSSKQASAQWKYYDGQMTSSNNFMGNIYDGMYEGIRNCNIYLTNYNPDIYYKLPELRGIWKGNVLLTRAFYKWLLVKHYGPLPMNNEIYSLDHDYSKDVRPSYANCVESIIADIDSAMLEDDLPWSVNNNDNEGTLTKGFAMALKSQVALYGASNNAIEWSQAATITKDCLTALKSHNYSIYKVATNAYQNAGSLNSYQDMFLIHPALSSNRINTEYIYNPNGTLNLWQKYGLPMNASNGVTTSGFCPSQELVDAYETSDGVPILNQKTPYLDNEHLQPNYNPAALKANGGLYDPESPYQNRDPRLHATIICNGDNFDLTNGNKPVETYVGGNNGFSTNNEQYTNTGYYLRKFSHWGSNKNVNKDGTWPYFRLAEMYLNFAEASFEANGVNSEAKSAIDAVRDRVDMPALPTGLSPEDFRLRLRNERRVEFAFEEERYFDLRRWNIQNEKEGIITGMKITKVNSDLSYERVVVQKRNVTEPKYRVMPIPRNEELRYAKYGISWQNEGWQ
ncbi:RagB/SusD family nutrient uptake outer membrane protein [Flavobacterium ovatum]|uniref:RagB/SusD family nutrient uptake outer membrane protein n=1 Tax=Flavobacterium ovatum TaxID=1928857 RepID=UPI003450EADE